MDIDQEDRVDDYLLDRMSEAQRTSFERLMDEDRELRECVGLRREFVAAIKRKKMKEVLVAEENRVVSRHKVWVSAYSAILAACLVIGIVLKVSSVNNCISLSDEFYSSIVIRGNNDVYLSLSSMMDAGEYKMLRKVISEQLPLLQKEFDAYKADGLSEKEQYDKDMVGIKIDELKWMEAISYMKQGKVSKAKNALKMISVSGGVYAESAYLILDRL